MKLNVVFCCSGMKGHADGFLIPMLGYVSGKSAYIPPVV